MCRRRREESALPLPVLVVRGDVEGIGISTVTMTTRMRKKERYYGSGEMESHYAVEAVPAAVEPFGRHGVAQKRDGPALGVLRRLAPAVLNRPTQHWYTGSTHTQVTAVRLGHRVYESPVE